MARNEPTALEEWLQRLEALGGKLSVESRPGVGTEVVAELPRVTP